MRRRQFTVLTGWGIAGATIPAMQAQAAAPDSALLKTKLTPLGAERAGNADGSIPPWTGGLAEPLLPETQPIDIGVVYGGDEAFQTVDKGNVAQFATLLTPGTQEMIRKFGFSIKIFQTCRTAAAPQYVYDNTAQNVTRTQFDPAAVGMGFTGAYGGTPFPIIDTGNPKIGGAQLIWNHLTSWRGISLYTKYAPRFVVADGKLILSAVAISRFIYPYYDPEGGPETYKGWFSKVRRYCMPLNLSGWSPGYWSGDDPEQQKLANAASWCSPMWNGDEMLTCFSTNATTTPDMMFCVRRASDEITSFVPMGTANAIKIPQEFNIYAGFDPAAAKIAGLDEYSCFNGTPMQYDWRFINKEEMLVPYNCNAMHFHPAQEVLQPKFPSPDIVRWEKHRVWIVEAQLKPGQTNALARRRLYIDEDSWLALLGEGYDAGGNMIKYHSVYNRCVGSLPATCELGSMVFDLTTGNYVFEGGVGYGNNRADEFAAPQPETLFEPQDMGIACY
jgi:hypothetical protein